MANDHKPSHFTISELAKQLDITPRTIRYYEELGLIQPKRSNGGTRYYTRKNRARLKLILRGRRFGFQLKEIREMITLFDEDRSGRKQLQRTVEYGEQKLTEIDEKIAELLQLREEISEYKQRFEEKLASLNS